ncbi:MAG TPA: HNH endonuclease signature motif containing protein [Candidatus Levybacteria bacterium]|nr:HNH endonuclease signature motif containing protein [Candidatus Levybacteria bacterium]
MSQEILNRYSNTELHSSPHDHQSIPLSIRRSSKKRRSLDDELQTFEKIKKRNRVSPKFSAAVRRQILQQQGYKCAVLEVDDPLQIHHKIPKSHGGTGVKENGVAVSLEVHTFLDKMAMNHHIYYDEIMERGKEYIIGYLNASPNTQDHITDSTPLDLPSRPTQYYFALDIAAGDD